MNGSQDKQAIILYDGVCNLCAGLVRFVIPRDPEGKFRFAALQSETGRRLMKDCGLDPGRLDTFVLIRGERAYLKSTAALQTARGLKGAWPLLYAFIAVPRPLRDWAYDRIAANRYRWFGRAESCLMPTPDNRRRFLDDGNGAGGGN